MALNEDDLRTVLEGLEDTKLEYVFARSRTSKTAAALREIGLSRNTFYKWPDREELEEIAQRLKRHRLMRVELMIEDAAEDAATVKVEGLKSKKEHIQQAVATEILNRTVGSPTERHELTGRQGGPIEFADMTDDERIARIAELLDDARERKTEESGDS